MQRERGLDETRGAGRGLAHMYHALLRVHVEEVDALDTLRVVARSVLALSFLAKGIVYVEHMKRVLEQDIYLILHVVFFTLGMALLVVRGVAKARAPGAIEVGFDPPTHLAAEGVVLSVLVAATDTPTGSELFLLDVVTRTIRQLTIHA